MISQATFAGGAVYHSGVTGVYQLNRWPRLQRIASSDAANRIVLPDATWLKPGGPHLVLVNDGSVTLRFVGSGALDSLLFQVAVGQRAIVHLLSNATAAGTWTADIRTTGPSGTFATLEGVVVGGAGSTITAIRLQNATDTMTTASAPPRLRQAAASFENKHEIFIGQTYGIGVTSNKLDGYKADTWRAIGDIPIAAGAGFGGFAMGKGFMGGGVNETRWYQFTVQSESWAQKTSLGFRRERGAGASCMDRVLWIAGSPDAAPSVEYLPQHDSFAVIPAYSSVRRAQQSAFTMLSEVFVCGGVDSAATVYDLVDSFDVAARSWTVRSVLPMGARYAGAALQSNRRGYFGVGLTGPSAYSTSAATYKSGSWASTTAWSVNKAEVENACGACL